MRRAFLEVGEDLFVPIEQVAADPSLRTAAIESLRREITGLSHAEQRVAKNTLQFLRSVRDGTAGGRNASRAVFPAIRAFLAGFAFRSAARLLARMHGIFAPRK
jgi:hypothetical protein